MRAEVRLVDRVDPDRWRALWDSDPRAIPSQGPGFLEGHPSALLRFFILETDDGTLRGILPFGEERRGPFFRQLSLPGGLFGGPLFQPGDGEAATLLLDAFRERGRHFLCLAAELVWAHEKTPAAGLEVLQTVGHQIPREDFDEFWMGHFPNNRRNECNRSEARGMVVNLVGSEASGDFDQFWSIYLEQCEVWKTPPLAREWLESLLALPSVRFFVAKVGDRVEGAHICIVQGEELFAWLGTSRRSREFFPASLLIKAEVQWAMQEGLARLNLGSSMGLGGVAHYKKLLGAQDFPRWIYRRVHPLLRWKRR